MGCFSTYCLCGIASTSADELVNYIDVINQDRIDENKEPFDIKKVKHFVKKTLHLNMCTFLTESNKIIHDCYEKSGCGQFKDGQNNNYSLLLHKEDDTRFKHKKDIKNSVEYGVFLHTDCWEHIKNKYNIELCFSDIKPSIIKELEDNSFVKIKYGGIVDRYIQGQYIDYAKIFEDGNLYLCYSPLKNKKNNKRFDKIIEQIILL
jgi:hypothetical protein